MAAEMKLDVFSRSTIRRAAHYARWALRRAPQEPTVPGPICGAGTCWPRGAVRLALQIGHRELRGDFQRRDQLAVALDARSSTTRSRLTKTLGDSAALVGDFHDAVGARRRLRRPSGERRPYIFRRLLRRAQAYSSSPASRRRMISFLADLGTGCPFLTRRPDDDARTVSMSMLSIACWTTASPIMPFRPTCAASAAPATDYFLARDVDARRLALLRWRWRGSHQEPLASTSW